jgi:glycerophosphoryl diester phosphodiesterase
VLVFGHRGARGEAPENTLPGFAYALRQGVLALELDVRLTADGRLAVVHDATVDRTTDASGSVATLTAAELARIDARAGHPDWPEPAPIPLLADVLASPAGRLRLAIEIKTDSPARLERVCAALAEQLRSRTDRPAEAAGGARSGGAVTVTSFDPTALELMRHLAPAIPRALIGAYDTPAFLETALRLGCRQADVPLARGSAGVVRQAQDRGLRVVGWPGNTEQDLDTLLEWGVDGITSDYPTRAIASLHARGVPHADDWD